MQERTAVEVVLFQGLSGTVRIYLDLTPAARYPEIKDPFIINVQCFLLVIRLFSADRSMLTEV